MAQSRMPIARREIKAGAPLSAPGFAEAISEMRRAFQSMEVVGQKGIKAKLEWANGRPRITIELETPP